METLRELCEYFDAPDIETLPLAVDERSYGQLVVGVALAAETYRDLGPVPVDVGEQSKELHVELQPLDAPPDSLVWVGSFSPVWDRLTFDTPILGFRLDGPHSYYTFQFPVPAKLVDWGVTWVSETGRLAKGPH